MVLAILAMGGSAFVGFLNKNEIDLEKKALAEVTRKVKQTSSDLNEVEDKVKDAEDERSMVTDLRDEQSAELNRAEQTMKGFQSSIAADTSKLEKTQLEQREIDLLIEKIGIASVDELQNKVQALADRKTELSNEQINSAAELETAKGGLVAIDNQVKDLKAYQIQRAQKVALNGLEASIVATNSQWGFVLVNAGKDLGVTADDSLLVKRGTSRVARLRIVSLEPDMVIAEVVEDSLPQGTTVQKGDRVIFETTN